MAKKDSSTAGVEYRAIPGFPGYRVGSDGSVWSCWRNAGPRNGNVRQITTRWKQRKLHVNKGGYRQINLKTVNARGRSIVLVHRLVLEAFIGPRPKNMECRHLNGVKSDCRLDNLAWGTKTENDADKKVHANYGLNACLYTRDGRILCLGEWATVFGIPYTTLRSRISRSGMTFSEAVARSCKSRAPR